MLDDPDSDRALAARPPRLIHSADFKTGLALCVFPLLWFWNSRDLALGSAMSMGPGYLPRLLCAVLFGFGVAITVKAVRAGPQPAPEPVSRRAILTVLAAIAFFAATVERAGLVVAVFGLVVISAFGERQARLPYVVLLGAFLAALAGGIFVLGLKLPIRLWPAGPSS